MRISDWSSDVCSSDLFGSGAIAAELKRQLGGKLEVLRRNLQVGSPLRREGDVYHLSGNDPPRGGEDQAYILFDAGHRALQVGLWENGKPGLTSTHGRAIAPPAKIRSLLARRDRKSTRPKSSHSCATRMPSSP